MKIIYFITPIKKGVDSKYLGIKSVITLSKSNDHTNATPSRIQSPAPPPPNPQ